MPCGESVELALRGGIRDTPFGSKGKKKKKSVDPEPRGLVPDTPVCGFSQDVQLCQTPEFLYVT